MNRNWTAVSPALHLKQLLIYSIKNDKNAGFWLYVQLNVARRC